MRAARPCAVTRDHPRSRDAIRRHAYTRASPGRTLCSTRSEPTRKSTPRRRTSRPPAPRAECARAPPRMRVHHVCKRKFIARKRFRRFHDSFFEPGETVRRPVPSCISRLISHDRKRTCKAALSRNHWQARHPLCWQPSCLLHAVRTAAHRHRPLLRMRQRDPMSLHKPRIPPHHCRALQPRRRTQIPRTTPPISPATR